MTYRDNSFPINKGKVNLTTGTFGGGAFLCTVDGSLVVTWDDDSTDTIACITGDAFNIKGCKTVEITAGTFHIG